MIRLAPECDLLALLGERLRAIRVSRDWSQRELANCIGTDRSAISDIEHGTVTGFVERQPFRRISMLSIKLLQFSETGRITGG